MSLHRVLHRVRRALTFAEVERERRRDNATRAAWCFVVATLGFGASVGAIAAETTWRALWVLPIGAITGAVAHAGLLRRHGRPEVLATWALVALQIELGVAAGLLGGAHSVLLLAMLVVVVGAPYLLNAPAAYLLLTASFGTLATVFAVHWGSVVSAPSFPTGVLTVTATLSCYSVMQMRTEINQRLAATLDPLTALLNRSSLAARLAELAEQARLAQRPFSVVAIDIDHFKSINDRHGHAVGDLVLREVAYRIRTNVRPFQPVYRLGGEEFLVLLPDLDTLAAHRVAERVERADAELYRAKQLGRNRTCSPVDTDAAGPAGGVPRVRASAS